MRPVGEAKFVIDLLIIRTLFVAVLACAAFFLHPFNLDGPVAAAVGAVVGAGVVVFEFRIREVSLKKLIGAGVRQRPGNPGRIPDFAGAGSRRSQ